MLLIRLAADAGAPSPGTMREASLGKITSSLPGAIFKDCSKGKGAGQEFLVKDLSSPKTIART